MKEKIDKLEKLRNEAQLGGGTETISVGIFLLMKEHFKKLICLLNIAQLISD